MLRRVTRLRDDDGTLWSNKAVTSKTTVTCKEIPIHSCDGNAALLVSMGTTNSICVSYKVAYSKDGGYYTPYNQSAGSLGILQNETITGTRWMEFTPGPAEYIQFSFGGGIAINGTITSAYFIYDEGIA